MYKQLEGVNRLLIEVELEPVQGDRFQPTGFPDIGAGIYELPDGTRKILLESAQSMANRLEETIIGSDNELLEDFDGLSYVAVNLLGASTARLTSLTEAHRLNSPFIISDKGFRTAFADEAGYAKGRHIDWRSVGRTIFKYDINSLLHGIFLSNLEDGRIKIPRIMTAFIEATDVREVVYGGVKNNLIDPSGIIKAAEFDKDGVYSNVPFHRMEYTASRINAFFNVDLGMIRSYDLGEKAEELLVGLCLYKIRSFLEGGLRLRTACDLKWKDDHAFLVKTPKTFSFPDIDNLRKNVQENIRACKNMFADPPVTVLVKKTVSKKKIERESTTEEK